MPPHAGGGRRARARTADGRGASGRGRGWTGCARCRPGCVRRRRAAVIGRSARGAAIDVAGMGIRTPVPHRPHAGRSQRQARSGGAGGSGAGATLARLSCDDEAAPCRFAQAAGANEPVRALARGALHADRAHDALQFHLQILLWPRHGSIESRIRHLRARRRSLPGARTYRDPGRGRAARPSTVLCHGALCTVTRHQGVDDHQRQPVHRRPHPRGARQRPAGHPRVDRVPDDADFQRSAVACWPP